MQKLMFASKNRFPTAWCTSASFEFRSGAVRSLDEMVLAILVAYLYISVTTIQVM